LDFHCKGWTEGSPTLSSFLCNYIEGPHDCSKEERKER